METYEIDTIKVEKQKAMRRYQIFRKLANIVRTLEVILAIALISFSATWTSSYIPTAVNFSGVFFRRVSAIFCSPHFVFFIGNAIIITLFAKSSSSAENNPKKPPETPDITFNFDINAVHDIPVVVEEQVIEEVVEKEVVVEKEKVYKRSKSVSPRMEMEVVKELRRSETQPRRKSEAWKRKEAEEKARRGVEEDEMSNEEFRRKVEEFIEKQQKALREEHMAVVISNHTSISV